MTHTRRTPCVAIALVLLAWPLALSAGEEPAPGPPAPAAAPEPRRELPASYYAELASVNQRYQQYDEAVRLYNEAMAREKDEGRRAAYAGSLADVYVAQGKHAEALPLLQDAIKSAPTPSAKSRYRVLLAQIAEKSNRPEDAIAAYKEAIASAQQPYERAGALRQLLELYRRTGKLADVLAENEKRVAANPKDAEALELLATAYTSVQGDPAKALAALSKLAEARPDDLNTLRQLAAAYQTASQPKEAIAAYEKLLAADESNRAYYCERICQLYADAGDKAKALEWARKMAQGSPDDAFAASRLARLLVRLGQAKEGLAEYERAASLARSDAERERTLLQCADAAVEAKLYDKAEAILRQIARESKLEDNRTQAKRALFKLYEDLGRLDELQLKTKDAEKKP